MIVVVGLLIQNSFILVQQRPKTSKRGGLWEFPGGKVDSGETMYQALKREWMEELGMNIEVAELIDEQVISFPEYENVLLPLFRIHSSDKPNPMEGQRILHVSLRGAMLLPGVPTMSAYESVLKEYCVGHC